MAVKTAHKDYPKQALLKELKYDSTTRVCPNEGRGEHVGFSRKYNMNNETCNVLAAGHNSKRSQSCVSPLSPRSRQERSR